MRVGSTAAESYVLEIGSIESERSAVLVARTFAGCLCRRFGSPDDSVTSFKKAVSDACVDALRVNGNGASLRIHVRRSGPVGSFEVDVLPRL